MVSVKTTLQPRCLEWARERAKLGTSDLAQKMGVKEDKVLQWERSGELSLAQVERLAHVTRTPVGFLFLPEPPIEKLPVADFRTVQAQNVSRPSPDLLELVNDALRRQDWYRDYLISNGGEPLAFVNSLSVNNDIVGAAKRILSVVNWNPDLRAKAGSWEVALSQQVDAIEESGILVMRSGIVGNNTSRRLSVSEFRGFALSDNYAPLIFVNGKDSKAAQIFTLAHELTHIWLGLSGVSNLTQTYSPDIATERFCNSVAGELLVPLVELNDQWNVNLAASDQIPHLVKYFKVSSLVILRRLRDADYIDIEEFNRLYTDELIQFNKPSAANSGGNFYLTLRTRLGKRFTSALVASAIEGITPYREAFNLLGVSNRRLLIKLAATVGGVA